MVSGRPREFTEIQGEHKSLGNIKQQQRLPADKTESFKKFPMGFPIESRVTGIGNCCCVYIKVNTNTLHLNN